MTDPLLATEATTEPEGQTDTEATSSEQVESTEQTTQQETTTEPEAPEEPEGPPEAYQFKSLHGDEVDEKIHDAYDKVARDLGLPQDKAQAMFENTMTALQERAVEFQEQQTKEWRDAAQADPELRGGGGFDENVATALKAVDAYGTDGLRELLNAEHGVGNHPEMIRFLFKVGQAVSQDSYVGGNTPQAVDASDEAVMAKKLYPSAKD